MNNAKSLFTIPTLSKEILWSTFVQFAGKALQIVLGIFTVKLITTALGSENYGTYGKISEFSLFFATAANLGIFGNMVRKMSLDPTNKNVFGNAILLRLFTGLAFFSAGWIYAWLTIQDSTFLIGTLFFMSSLLLDFITTVCDALLQVHYKMGRATLALLLGRITNLAVIFSLSTWLRGNPETISIHFFLLGPLLASVITLSSSFLFTRQILKPSWIIDRKLMKELFWSSIPFGIINIINNLYFRFIPSALLAKTLSNENFGIYTLSLHLTSGLALLSTLFMYSVLPVLERHIKKTEWKEAGNLYKNASRFLMFGFVALVGFGTWLGPWLLTIVSSKDFVSPKTWFILPLLLILAGVSYFYDLALLSLFALKQDIWWLKREVMALGICIIFGITTLFVANPDTSAILILIGAIVAETTMVICGMKRMKLLLKKKGISH